ncbi:endonuclease [Catellatospora sp. IY07-71]|uniref:Z1 domain-containing protein n=1 Tax=Catellatospora sp. IY07-71 TaxID=2728827 RepID=UPI001BB3B5AC|nr:Z1 domain-containing protein [Catellatospora sp. IY07-71]BCJ73688.1 endonuclease [Catellatospora sp. IY07-71]
MSTAFDQQYQVFLTLAQQNTPAAARDMLETLALDPAVIERILERYEQDTLAVRDLREPRSVVLNNRFTWYTGPRKGDRCWPALQTLLRRDGWNESALESLDDASTKVLALMSHPREKAFAVRGLVVGYVQSGKTTNFTSVLAKAADRGYKLFIVLAGIHNGLRRQTQLRLQEQLVRPNPLLWHQLTDPDRDFSPPANAAAFFNDANHQYVLCVVKKNPTVLRKFTRWLDSARGFLGNAPALVIDDEADQATVATRTINPLIRGVLDRLPKACYVGYTATPFANLLIDPSARDLYPEHFVVNLPRPDRYFGPEVIFGREVQDHEDPADVPAGHDMVRIVPDDDVDLLRPAKGEADDFAPEMTDSLRTAVAYFCMATAARTARGTGNPHSTMLIHTSVSTSVHQSFDAPLRDLLRSLAHEVAGDDLADLRRLWESECGRVSAEDFGEKAIPFDTLLPYLPQVIDRCRVIMDNSTSNDRLDYENGPVIAIAVGGNTLSRGLTLEGLCVSYFVRSVSAYDTLLQMGRWFGFRNGYADLPRIWMTRELREWFRHLASVEAEMRRDIDVYMTEDKTPLDFAVRIRTHPALLVTAAAKMKSAVKAAAAYGGQRVQTRYFPVHDVAWLQENQRHARRLVQLAATRGCRVDRDRARDRVLLRDVPHELILDFLDGYRFHDRSQECDSALIRAYIRKRGDQRALRQWNIALIGNPTSDAEGFEFAPGIAVGRVTRSRLDPDSDVADIKTLMSRRDAAVDLVVDRSGELSEDAIKKLRRVQLPDHGLLTLYAIDRHSPTRRPDRHPLQATDHVIGVGLVFPEPRESDSAVEREYVSANLAGLHVEEEDLAGLETEES